MVETRGPLRVEHSIRLEHQHRSSKIKRSKMSEQFFYVHLKFTPKSISLAAPIGSPHEIVVEVPKGLLKQRQSDVVGQDFTEKATPLDLARDVALQTASPFPAIGERAAGLYDEDPPIWYEYPHRVMNQRPCDHEERGIRAWKIA
jgi:hypothetical protein